MSKHKRKPTDGRDFLKAIEDQVIEQMSTGLVMLSGKYVIQLLSLVEEQDAIIAELRKDGQVEQVQQILPHDAAETNSA